MTNLFYGKKYPLPSTDESNSMTRKMAESLGNTTFAEDSILIDHEAKCRIADALERIADALTNK